MRHMGNAKVGTRPMNPLSPMSPLLIGTLALLLSIGQMLVTVVRLTRRGEFDAFYALTILCLVAVCIGAMLMLYGDRQKA